MGKPRPEKSRRQPRPQPPDLRAIDGPTAGGLSDRARLAERPRQGGCDREPAQLPNRGLGSRRREVEQAIGLE